MAKTSVAATLWSTKLAHAKNAHAATTVVVAKAAVASVNAAGNSFLNPDETTHLRRELFLLWEILERITYECNHECRKCPNKCKKDTKNENEYRQLCR